MLLTVNATSGATWSCWWLCRKITEKVSSVTIVKIPCEPDAVIKRATSGSRVIGSRSLDYRSKVKQRPIAVMKISTLSCQLLSRLQTSTLHQTTNTKCMKSGSRNKQDTEASHTRIHCNTKCVASAERKVSVALQCATFHAPCAMQHFASANFSLIWDGTTSPGRWKS